MKKYCKIGIYMLCLFLFATWMIVSNDLIAAMSGQNTAKRINIDDYREPGRVYFAFDSFDSIGSMNEVISFSGWAFVESDFDNRHSKTSIILHNDDDSYIMTFQDPENESNMDWDIMRDDVVAAYPGYKITTSHVGFRGDFSTLNVKNGVYDIYIYRQENEHDSGLVNTRKQLVKNETDFIFRDRAIEQGDFQKLEITGEGRGLLDRFDDVSDKTGTYLLSGWAFGYTEKANDEKTISVVLKAQNSNDCYIYEQAATQRPDVYSTFSASGNIVGVNHGFQAQFSIEPMPDGVYDLYIYVEENSECMCLLDMDISFIKNGQMLSMETTDTE